MFRPTFPKWHWSTTTRRLNGGRSGQLSTMQSAAGGLLSISYTQAPALQFARLFQSASCLALEPGIDTPPRQGGEASESACGRWTSPRRTMRAWVSAGSQRGGLISARPQAPHKCPLLPAGRLLAAAGAAGCPAVHGNPFLGGEEGDAPAAAGAQMGPQGHDSEAARRRLLRAGAAPAAFAHQLEGFA